MDLSRPNGIFLNAVIQSDLLYPNLYFSNVGDSADLFPVEPVFFALKRSKCCFLLLCFIYKIVQLIYYSGLLLKIYFGNVRNCNYVEFLI